MSSGSQGSIESKEFPIPLSLPAPVRISWHERFYVCNRPINGVLDLHTFQPGEVKDLVPEYLAECQKRGILQVRIIHGKGTGTLRRIVQEILEKLPYVKYFRTAEDGAGGWGATIVELRGVIRTSEEKKKAG